MWINAEILTVFDQLYTFKLCTIPQQSSNLRFSQPVWVVSRWFVAKQEIETEPGHAVYMVGQILLDMVGIIFLYGISFNIVYNESGYKNMNKL